MQKERVTLGPQRVMLGPPQYLYSLQYFLLKIEFTAKVPQKEIRKGLGNRQKEKLCQQVQFPLTLEMFHSHLLFNKIASLLRH